MGFSTSNNAFYLDTISDRVAPPFLQGPNGSAWIGAMAQGLDVIRFRSAQAMLIHMPGFGDPSGLYYVGSDRYLVQGTTETNASFTARLQRSYDDWQHAGDDWGLLQQTLAAVSPSTPPVFVVSDGSGNGSTYSHWSWYAAGASTTLPPLAMLSRIQNWNWDNELDPFPAALSAQAWWRVWIGIGSYAPNAWATQWATLGNGSLPTLGSSGAMVGSLGFANVTPAFWTQLRGQIEAWCPEHAWVRWIVVTFSSAVLSQDGTAGGANPNGTWGRGYVITAGQYTATGAWNANTAPVPGTPPPTSGSVGQSFDRSTYGYRIVSGQYLPA